MQTGSDNRRRRIIPDQIVLMYEKPPSWWRETLDWRPLCSAVNKLSGSIDFSLPLLPGSAAFQSICLHYQGDSSGDSLLGVGWDLNALQDYLTIDYQQSLDVTLHRHYWVRNGQAILLTLVQNDQRTGKMHFTLSQRGEVKEIVYDKLLKEWLILYDNGEQCFYGGVSESESDNVRIAWTVSWLDWRGPGSAQAQQERLPIQWHIREKRAQN